MCRIKRSLFLLILAASAFAQSCNKDSIISIIKRSKHIEGERIGIMAHKSEVYEAATQLWEQCTVDELVELCASGEPVLRCYAFLGIIACRDERRIAEQVADLHRKDTAKVTSFNFCIGWSFMVSEYMEMQLRNFYTGEKGYRRLGK